VNTLGSTKLIHWLKRLQLISFFEEEQALEIIHIGLARPEENFGRTRAEKAKYL